MPERPTGPAGSRHSLTGSFLLSLRSPFSCWQLETFPSNLDNFPLFLLPAFKIHQCHNATLHTALDFPCSFVQVFPRPLDSPGKNTGVGCHLILQCMKVKRESEVAQSCPTLSDPMDCSLPGSSVHGICQARVLEWVAIVFCNQGKLGSVDLIIRLVSTDQRRLLRQGLLDLSVYTCLFCVLSEVCLCMCVYTHVCASIYLLSTLNCTSNE